MFPASFVDSVPDDLPQAQKKEAEPSKPEAKPEVSVCVCVCACVYTRHIFMCDITAFKFHVFVGMPLFAIHSMYVCAFAVCVCMFVYMTCVYVWISLCIHCCMCLLIMYAYVCVFVQLCSMYVCLFTWHGMPECIMLHMHSEFIHSVQCIAVGHVFVNNVCICMCVCSAV